MTGRGEELGEKFAGQNFGNSLCREQLRHAAQDEGLGAGRRPYEASANSDKDKGIIQFFVPERHFQNDAAA